MIGENYAFGYRPYGTTIDLARYASDDDRRWQGKELDYEHDKLYFGARFYDPFFDLWMSPDPAGQFANPYSYGGDPVNFIDPSGMFAVGVGFVFGWDQSHGWQWGLGVAGDYSYNGSSHGSSYNLSYTWNQDGSGSFSIGGNGQWQWWILNFNAGLGFSYNSYTGSVLSTQGGVCVGNTEVACVGIENGYGLHWDAAGNFMGMTTYLEAYAEAAGGLSRVSSGYEWGLFGAEARGGYAGATLAGIHAEISQNGGASWGFEERLYSGIGNNSSSLAADGTTASMVKWELWMPTLGNFGHFTFGNGYDVSSIQLDKIEMSKLKEIIKDEALLRDIIKAGSVKNFGKNLADRINIYLLENGYERNDHIGKHEKGSEKRTYRPVKSGIYGNLEIVVGGDGSTYSSYNYGNNRLSHILIEFLGWKGRGY